MRCDLLSTQQSPIEPTNGPPTRCRRPNLVVWFSYSRCTSIFAHSISRARSSRRAGACAFDVTSDQFVGIQFGRRMADSNNQHHQRVASRRMLPELSCRLLIFRRASARTCTWESIGISTSARLATVVARSSCDSCRWALDTPWRLIVCDQEAEYPTPVGQSVGRRNSFRSWRRFSFV